MGGLGTVVGKEQKTGEFSFLTQKDLEKANAKVKRSIECEAAKPQKASLQGKYNDYPPQERAWIGKHAAENGQTKAVKHFSQVLNRKVPKTTAVFLLASFPEATPRFYLAAMEKNREKAWDHCYVTDRKAEYVTKIERVGATA